MWQNKGKRQQKERKRAERNEIYLQLYRIHQSTQYILKTIKMWNIKHWQFDTVLWYILLCYKSIIKYFFPGKNRWDTLIQVKYYGDIKELRLIVLGYHKEKNNFLKNECAPCNNKQNAKWKIFQGKSWEASALCDWLHRIVNVW